MARLLRILFWSMLLLLLLQCEDVHSQDFADFSHFAAQVDHDPGNTNETVDFVYNATSAVHIPEPVPVDVVNDTLEYLVMPEPIPSDTIESMEFVHNTNGTVYLLEQTRTEVTALEKVTQTLVNEVSSLRSSDIAMSITLHALHAAKEQEIQTLRNEFREAMNQTTTELKAQSSLIALLQSQIEALQSGVPGNRRTTTDISTEPTPTKATHAPDSKCDFVHGSYCFFVYTWYIEYSTAVQACSVRNASLGYPLDKQSYYMTLETVREKMPPNWRGWTGIWMGYRYSASGGLTLSNGENPPYVRWRTGEPSSGWKETRVMNMVYKTKNDGQEGFDDIDPERNLQGALCMREIQ